MMSVMVLWIVKPYGGYQRSGETCSCHLRGKMKTEASPSFETMAASYHNTWLHNTTHGSIYLLSFLFALRLFIDKTRAVEVASINNAIIEFEVLMAVSTKMVTTQKTEIF